MIYKFEIKEEIVMKRVSLATAYMATRRSAAEAAKAYDNIAVTIEDWEILKDFLVNACNELTAFIQKYVIARTSVDDEGNDGNLSRFDYELSMPSNWDFKKVDIAKAALEFVVESVLAKWLAIAEKDNVQAHADLAKAQLDLIAIGIHSRRRPIRNF